MDKKWYIVHMSAEECSTTYVELTDEEYAIIFKFVNHVQENTYGYCGNITISDVGYASQEEAQKHA